MRTRRALAELAVRVGTTVGQLRAQSMPDLVAMLAAAGLATDLFRPSPEEHARRLQERLRAMVPR